jgi:hypothetical protein
MRKRKTATLLAALALALGGCASVPAPPPAGEARAAAWFEAHRGRPPLLRAFLQRMPKGGDIHFHLTGSVYAESYVGWAAAAGTLCVNPATSTYTTTCTPPNRPAADALSDTAFYAALVDGLSTRNLANRQQSGHDQFFDAFGRFSAATQDNYPAMLAEVTTRAADQHIQYLEILLTLRGTEVKALSRSVPFDPQDFAASRQRLLDAGLRDQVTGGLADLAAIEQDVARLLGCGAAPAPPVCRVTRRYLQQTTRTAEPASVFAQLLYAFEAAQAGRGVVGLNLVAPEDHPVALRDYHLQMQMIGWLAGQYPGVPSALHAGELRLGLVPPADLRFHIREAVEVAGARRIGHGVGIAYERDALQLLAELRERKVLVEICLTSNDVILGVSGARHPFPDYRAAGVPVTLATDDEGISRIDLTNEYQRAAETYGLGYRDLKQLARNSLAYSFLDDAEKARQQGELERAFEEFEALPWWGAGGR